MVVAASIFREDSRVVHMVAEEEDGGVEVPRSISSPNVDLKGKKQRRKQC